MTPPFVETMPTAASLEYSIGAMRAYLELCGEMTNRYDQQDRRRGRPNKWLRSIKGQAVPVTPDDMLRHLSGDATYAATYADADGMTMLLVADDDHGGIERAQAAVDGLKACGIDAWAIARTSIDDLGNPRHNGSKLLTRVVYPGLHLDDAKRAFKALCQLVGYSTDEVMTRAELPFGRSKWTPAGDEYGQLVLAGRAPQRIESGPHGMALLTAAGLTPADPDHLMTFAPAKPEPKPQAPVKRESTGATLENTAADVIAKFNDTYTVYDVFGWAGWRKIGPVNYRCGCGAHKASDRMPSVGISRKDGGAYFNTPGCRYHNDKRGYSPFSLNQHINHGGDYKAAMNEARYLLSMPFVPTRKPAADEVSTTPRTALQPAQVVPQDAIDVERIIEEIGRRVKAGVAALGELTTAVLRTICRLARAAGGYAQASYETLADLSGVSESTARRAVERLERLRFIRKHANATPAGQYAANVLEILPQSATNDLAATAGTGVNTTPVGTESGIGEQSILSTIKEEECIPAFSIDTSIPAVPVDHSPLFNSPPAKKQTSVIAQTWAEREAEWSQRFYGGTTPRLTGAGKPRNGTDRYDHPMNRQTDPDMDRPQLPEWGTVPRADDQIDISADDDGISRWELARRHRVATGEIGPAPRIGALVDATDEPEMPAETPEPTPSLIAPPEQKPLPASALAGQMMIMPRRRIETAADLADAPQAIETAPATLAEIEPLLDRAAAAGDKAAMLAHLGRLGALDRALANGKYNAVLCQMGAARRIAR